MVLNNPLYSYIAGTGSYLPAHILTNADLEKRCDTTDAWIVERTGIRQRHIAQNTEENTTSMAILAAKRALEAADLKQVDMIIVATTTPTAFFPSTACSVQAALDCPNGPAFDIAAACAGFNYALATADQFIRQQTVKSALVIGSETMSRVLDWQDRSTCVLFGDGAGAVVLVANKRPGILSTHLHADGNYQNLLRIDNTSLSKPQLKMPDGPAVFRHAVSKMGDTLTHILAEQQLDVMQLDWLIPHQANIRIIYSLAKKLKLPESRIIITIDRQANTSSASIPLALDTAIQEGRIQRNQLLLLESFGSGLTWGASLIRY
jgi:3-oxoacyl-[acyl-carrier-protein] synthase III